MDTIPLLANFATKQRTSIKSSDCLSVYTDFETQLLSSLSDKYAKESAIALVEGNMNSYVQMVRKGVCACVRACVCMYVCVSECVCERE